MFSSVCGKTYLNCQNFTCKDHGSEKAIEYSFKKRDVVAEDATMAGVSLYRSERVFNTDDIQASFDDQELVDHFKVRVSHGIEVNEGNIAKILRHKKDDISNYNVDFFEHVLELRDDQYEDYDAASDGENFDRFFYCALLTKKEENSEVSEARYQFILLMNCQPKGTDYDYSTP